MYAISDEVRAALMGGGLPRIEVYGELWDGRPRVKVATVDISGGSVTADANAPTRRSCDVTLPNIDSLVPDVEVVGTNRLFGDRDFGDGLFGDYRRRELRGLLMPMRTQLRLFWRAVWETPGGATQNETIPLGRFTIGTPSFHDSEAGEFVTLTGLDAAADVAASAWTAPRTIPKGTNVATALERILDWRAPGIAFTAPSTSLTTPRIVYLPGGQTQRSNPWEDAAALAASAGWDLYVARTGGFVAAADPPASDPVWDLADNGTAMSFESSPDASELCNTVLVYVENSGEKPVVEVVQNMSGPYGVNTMGRVVAREFRSPLLTTRASAAAAGVKLLRRWSSLTETVAMTTFPCPHLDPGDPVTVASDALELDGTYRVERVVTSLDPSNLASQVTVSRTLG